MKRITTIALMFFLCTLQILAQIPTRNSRDSVSINGIKFGYIYLRVVINVLKSVKSAGAAFLME